MILLLTYIFGITLLFPLSTNADTNVTDPKKHEKTAHSKLLFSQIRTDANNSKLAVYYTVERDSIGKTWVGTHTGLFRIEDNNIVYDNGISDVILDAAIVGMGFDADGILWAGSSTRFLKYDTKNYKLEVLAEAGSIDSLIPKNEGPMSLLVEDDAVWIGMYSRLARYNKDTESFKTWSLSLDEGNGKNEHKIVYARSLHKQNHELWIGTYFKGLMLFDENSEKMRSYKYLEEDGKKIAVERIKKIIRSPIDEDDLLLATAQGLLTFDTSSKQFRRFNDSDLARGITNGLSVADNGEVWAGGEYLYSITRSGDIIEYDKTLDLGLTDANANIDYIDVSKDGTISVFVQDNGVFRANQKTSMVRFLTNFNGAIGKSRALLRDSRGNIWAGFEEGLLRGRIKNGKFEYTPIKIDGENLPSDIRDISETINGDIAIAQNNKISLYRNDQWDIFDLETKIEDGSFVSDILGTHENLLDFSLNHRGVFTLNTSTGEVIKNTHYDDANPENYANVQHSQSPSGEYIMLANHSSTFFWDMEGNRPLVETERSFRELISSHDSPLYIWNTQQVSNDKFFILYNFGVFTVFSWSCMCFEMIETPFFTTLAASQANFPNAPYWFSDREGNVLFWDRNFDESKVINFKNDILPVGVSIFDSAHLDSGGALFGTENGLVWADKSFFPREDALQPTTILDHIVINGSEQYRGDLGVTNASYLDMLDLPKASNDIRFRYSSTNSSPNYTVSHRYRLSGFDDEWRNNTEGEKSAVFTNLPYGSFVFEVQSSVDGKSWGQAAKLPVTIRPALWETKYAYILYIMIVLGVGYGTHVLRARTLVRRNSLLELAVEEKTEKIDRQLIEIKDHLEFKKTYLIDLNHELKNMLQNQYAEYDNLEAFLTKNPGFDPIRIKWANTRMSRIVDQLLSLAALESGQSMEKHTVDVVKLLKLSLPLFDEFANRAGVSVNSEITDNALFVHVEVSMLERIISNLVSNAIKYNRPEGYVIVKAYHNENEVVIEVRDSGKGINLSLIPDFFKIEGVEIRSTKREQSNFPSYGLGLKLIASAVQANNGIVSVSSEKGFGTNFKVAFPIASSKDVLEYNLTDSSIRVFGFETTENNFVTHEIEESLSFQEGRDCILIVDDNRSFLATCANTLNKSFNILVADNGEDALSIIGDKLPDLVITDLNMPEMNGFELLSSVKKDKNFGHIPVIVITAASTRDIYIEGLVLGADDIILKPASNDEILHKIVNKLDLRKRIWKKILTEGPELHHDVNMVINSTKRAEESVTREWLAKINDYITENAATKENLKVGAIASFMRVNQEALSTTLRQMTGIDSVRLYVRDYRLSLAHKELQTREVGKLEFFAEEFGFTGAEFSRRYKIKYGHTPSETKQMFANKTS